MRVAVEGFAQRAVGQMPPEAFNRADAVAAAVLTAVDAEEALRRLATGCVSFNMIKDSLEARLSNLNEWSAVSNGVDSYAG